MSITGIDPRGGQTAAQVAAAIAAAVPSVNAVQLTEACTATVDGTGTGTVADGTDFVTVTSDDATKIVVLPTCTPGQVVALELGANGYELRTDDPATVGINGGTAAGAESAIPANTLTICVAAAAGDNWRCSNTDAAGVVTQTEIAA